MYMHAVLPLPAYPPHAVAISTHAAALAGTASYCTGKNIEGLRALYQETDVAMAKDLATRIYNTLTAAKQLGIAAIQVCTSKLGRPRNPSNRSIRLPCEQ